MVVQAVPVAVALGSNQGDREQTLRAALTALTTHLDNLCVSQFYETEPVGVGDQPQFLNAAATGYTTETAGELLQNLLGIERRLGRVRPYAGAPRTIDLDLIFYGNAVVNEPDLVVPHPRFRERTFVLQPLADIAADWIDPVTGLAVEQLLRQVRV